MPQNPARLEANQPVIEPDDSRTMSQVFRTWALRVTNALPIVGAGTPEGVIEAPQYSLYIDETVPLVPVSYRKMLPEIGGDRSKGWAVV